MVRAQEPGFRNWVHDTGSRTRVSEYGSWYPVKNPGFGIGLMVPGQEPGIRNLVHGTGSRIRFGIGFMVPGQEPGFRNRVQSSG